MKFLRLVPLVLLFAAPSPAEAEGEAAWSLAVVEPMLAAPEIEVMESAPPQFALRFTADMPTPLWKIEVDDVSRPDAAGRIVAKITAIRPEGMVPQVITPETFRVLLGRLDAGDYLVEIHWRWPETAHRRVGAYLLEARGN
ncbi:MAG: hypothetical protein ACYTG6_07805 [Planctomycetota bacterium]|jgi:hypothetical protein